MTAVLQNWVLASRPVTLSASVVPVLVGTTMAMVHGSLNWSLFVLALFGSILIQIGTNLIDEYTDHRRSSSPKFSAPHKVIQRGLLSEKAVFRGGILCFGVASGMGLYIVSQVGPLILLVGIVSLLAGYLYSSGPVPLGNVGLGELTVFVFMGPLIVLSSYFVQTESISWSATCASLPIGMLVTAILQANNLRDIDEDLGEGKHTLSTFFGARAGSRMYTLLVLGSYLVVILGGISSMLPKWASLSLMTIPSAIGLSRRLGQTRSRSGFNAILIGTAQLHMRFGALMAFGILIDRDLVLLINRVL